MRVEKPRKVMTVKLKLSAIRRFFRFLKDVKLSDLVLPGRRIEVPAERLLTASSSGTSPA